MKEDKNILEKIGRRDGMTVPEGYFADFAARMADSLEKTPFEESSRLSQIVKPRSLWQRIRPYAYMAAMFAGVWCMLKMFTLMSTPHDSLQVPSATMAEALGNEVFVNDYILSNLNEMDLMDDLMEQGFDFAEIDEMPDSLIPTQYTEQ